VSEDRIADDADGGAAADESRGSSRGPGTPSRGGSGGLGGAGGADGGSWPGSGPGTPLAPPRKLTRNMKRKHDEINHVQKVRVCECVFGLVFVCV
jgi:hypothetical protein